MFYCGFSFLLFISRQIHKSPCVAYSFAFPQKYLESVHYHFCDRIANLCGLAKLLITNSYFPIVIDLKFWCISQIALNLQFSYLGLVLVGDRSSRG